MDELTVEVTASIGGLSVPWPGFDTDGCANLVEGQTCPVPAGERVIWDYLVVILPEYPPVSNLSVKLIILLNVILIVLKLID